MDSQYLVNNDSASGLTSTLLELTREQRHLAMRVIISTQGKRCVSYIFNRNAYCISRAYCNPADTP